MKARPRANQGRSLAVLSNAAGAAAATVPATASLKQRVTTLLQLVAGYGSKRGKDGFVAMETSTQLFAASVDVNVCQNVLPAVVAVA